MEICCNIDDDSAERIAWIVDELRALGALDVWLTNVHGKKGRPAVMLSVLVPIDRWSTHADWLLRHSSTFGLRYRTWERLKLRPHREVRDVGGRQVPFKVGRTRAGEPVKAKPEFEELRRVWSDDPDFKA